MQSFCRTPQWITEITFRRILRGRRFGMPVCLVMRGRTRHQEAPAAAGSSFRDATRHAMTSSVYAGGDPVPAVEAARILSRCCANAEVPVFSCKSLLWFLLLFLDNGTVFFWERTSSDACDKNEFPASGSIENYCKLCVAISHANVYSSLRVVHWRK